MLTLENEPTNQPKRTRGTDKEGKPFILGRGSSGKKTLKRGSAKQQRQSAARMCNRNWEDMDEDDE